MNLQRLFLLLFAIQFFFFFFLILFRGNSIETNVAKEEPKELNRVEDEHSPCLTSLEDQIQAPFGINFDKPHEDYPIDPFLDSYDHSYHINKRFNWMKSRNTRPASSDLVEALQRYEGKYRDAFVDGNVEDHNYIVWPGCWLEGWGSRFNSMVSGLVLGLLTDRLLFFQNGTDRVASQFFDYKVPSNQFEKIYQRLSEESKKGRVSGTDTVKLTKDLMLQTEEELFGRERIWNRTYVTEDYVVIGISRNPHFRERFVKLFPTSEAFGYIFRWFFQLKSEYRNKWRQLEEKEFGSMDFSVGIHLRRMKRKIMQWETPDLPLHDYCYLAKSLAMNSHASLSTIKIFLSADDDSVLNTTMNCLRPYKVFHREFSKEKSFSGNEGGSEENALMDWLMLSNRSEIICTTGSSFGYSASASTLLRPYYITFPQRRSIENPPFWQATYSEPCLFGCRWLKERVKKDELKLFRADGNWINNCWCHPK